MGCLRDANHTGGIKIGTRQNSNIAGEGFILELYIFPFARSIIFETL